MKHIIIEHLRGIFQVLTLVVCAALTCCTSAPQADSGIPQDHGTDGSAFVMRISSPPYQGAGERSYLGTLSYVAGAHPDALFRYAHRIKWDDATASVELTESVCFVRPVDDTSPGFPSSGLRWDCGPGSAILSMYGRELCKSIIALGDYKAGKLREVELGRFQIHLREGKRIESLKLRRVAVNDLGYLARESAIEQVPRFRVEGP